MSSAEDVWWLTPLSSAATEVTLLYASNVGLKRLLNLKLSGANDRLRSLLEADLGIEDCFSGCLILVFAKLPFLFTVFLLVGYFFSASSACCTYEAALTQLLLIGRSSY